MKKLLIGLVCLILFSCDEVVTTKYYIEYEVHYPDRTDTLTAVKEFMDEPKVESHRGTNYIYYLKQEENCFFRETLIETSAPINIIMIKSKP